MSDARRNEHGADHASHVARSPLPFQRRYALSRFEVTVRSLPEDLRATRRAITRALIGQSLEGAHIEAVALVAHELLIALCERQTSLPVVVTVEPLPLLTSVRVRTTTELDAVFEAFGVTERLLTALTIAFGLRPSAGGGTELWAEVPRVQPARPPTRAK